MRRGTVVVIVFILLVAVVVGASQFFRSQPPLELTVAASPLIERWLRPAVEAFNATNPIVNATRRVRFTVTPIDDLAAWVDDRRAPWTPEQHPVAWVPASSLSVDYANSTRRSFALAVDSVAQTPLLWGGFASRANAVTNGGAQPLDWPAVAEAAAAERWADVPGGNAAWGFVKLAYDRPDQTMSGLAVLFSGAAAYGESADVNAAVANSADFRNWFAPVVRGVANFNTLGGDAAAAMASRGASVAEVALLPESRWLTNLDGLLRHDEILLAYPRYDFVFDFPLARWNQGVVPIEESQAVDALAAWLLADARQNTLVDYGLRPASGIMPEDAPLFAAAEPYGVRLQRDLSQPVGGLSRTEAQRLLQWFNSVR